MGTALHSFADIFNTVFYESQEEIHVSKIVIPIIQRDYAQGRIDPAVNRIRERFLDSLYTAVTEKPIVLDFVYGDIDKNGILTPLDGQQRLTTLFLLHWYASRKAAVPEEKCAFLSKFSYETRYSARDFCAELVQFRPSCMGQLSKEIINQTWFPLDWQKDPTVSSMLVMLDAINEKFQNANDLWEKLMDYAITFYFLPINDMGLTDELYIKMNSRGKPLTAFEHFKAELERDIRSVDEKLANRIIRKIDCDWTDLLWKYRNGGTISEENITDDIFLRYFKFICDIICYKGGESPQGKSSDEFDLLQRYFSAGNPDAYKNIIILESFFDCWCEIPEFDMPTEFLNSFMARIHETGKIRVNFDTDIFRDCLYNYSIKTGEIRRFPLNRTVLLYAIVFYLCNRDKVSYSDFTRRIRIVNNLIQNSNDEISDRTDRNRIPAILLETEAILITGEIDETINNSFNVNQLKEEKDKCDHLRKNPNDAENLYKLEDNEMLYGQIGIVGLDHLAYADRFISLFSCKWDNIDCALMSLGDYGQRNNEWRYQYAFGGKKYAWDQLFHRSYNTGFEQTRETLIALLEKSESFTNAQLELIKDSFIKNCETNSSYPWRYYYVKYREFRPVDSYGKLSKNDAHPYLVSVMMTRTKWSPNTYIPYFKAADGNHVSRDNWGQRLAYEGEYIICENKAFAVCRNEDETVIDRIYIDQNNEIDTEDRIIKLKQYISERYGNRS